MYNMYLSQETNNETMVLKLPALPEEIEIKCDVDNKKYNVLEFGDIIKAGKRGLKSYSLSSYFPAEDGPEVYISIIEKMIDNQLPIRFIINRVANNRFAYDSNISILIDSFSFKEEGGEVGDIYYSFKFTEYREHKAKVIAGV